jgi:hypothetical protein
MANVIRSDLFYNNAVMMDLTAGKAFFVFLHLSLRVLEIYTESWNKSAYKNLSYMFVRKCTIYFSYTASTCEMTYQVSHLLTEMKY